MQERWRRQRRHQGDGRDNGGKEGDYRGWLKAEKDKQCAGGTLSLLLRYLRSDFAIPMPKPTSLDRNSRQADYLHWQPLNDIAAEQPSDVQFGVLQLLKMHL